MAQDDGSDVEIIDLGTEEPLLATIRSLREVTLADPLTVELAVVEEGAATTTATWLSSVWLGDPGEEREAQSSSRHTWVAGRWILLARLSDGTGTEVVLRVACIEVPATVDCC